MTTSQEVEKSLSLSQHLKDPFQHSNIRILCYTFKQVSLIKPDKSHIFQPCIRTPKWLSGPQRWQCPQQGEEFPVWEVQTVISIINSSDFLLASLFFGVLVSPVLTEYSQVSTLHCLSLLAHPHRKTDSTSKCSLMHSTDAYLHVS